MKIHYLFFISTRNSQQFYTIQMEKINLNENPQMKGDYMAFNTLVFNDEFDVQIGASDIVPENFNSAEAMWKMIQNLKD